jgi:hypothetical protein
MKREKLVDFSAPHGSLIFTPDQIVYLEDRGISLKTVFEKVLPTSLREKTTEDTLFSEYAFKAPVEKSPKEIEVWVDGEWDASIETTKDVVVYSKGTVFTIQREDYNSFIDCLENKGYDCYFCPALFSHPDWSGNIVLKN